LAIDSRKKLGLIGCTVDQLTPIKTHLLGDGNKYLMEISLEDKTNQNSCNLTYFQIGEKL